jgi:exonuclease SbcC
MYLERVLPRSHITDAVVDAAYQPLVLLQTSHLMAAFAFSNGDMGKTYDTLYGRFKKYYAEQQSQWRDLDLAFVFCVPPDAPQVERFCSKIETDVYFCRKYVIPLGPQMGASLARLPFLPLAAVGGRPLRPASAQTFLQQCGVRAALAKYLVVQQQRSPDGIVKDCLSGTFGEPQGLTPVENASAPDVEAGVAAQPIWLQTVVIKNFRAYRKTQRFAIGADVTVLYGPNGFGKTSFFDAIDFAVTGGIGRFRSVNDARFKKIARHLDSMAISSHY